MTYGELWPAHPKPLPDELLSSWIVRVATANGIKLQTLARMLFGADRTPWNRDIDRSAPAWLTRALSKHTGIPAGEILETTLMTYAGRLHPHPRISGHLGWVLTIRTNGTKRQAFGQQYCPACLADDPIPYFRKRWRVALSTYCPVHRIELHDACPDCGSPVMHYRGDFGRELKDAWPMSACHACRADLRDAERRPEHFPSQELRQLCDEMLWSLDKAPAEAGRFDLDFFVVLHQICRAMGTRQNRGKLLGYLLHQLGLPPRSTPTGWITIEERRREERHAWLLCALWLMADLEGRLTEAWVAKAVRYNLMIKDLNQAPSWFRNVVDALPGLRSHPRRERQSGIDTACRIGPRPSEPPDAPHDRDNRTGMHDGATTES
jgi:hypothetical protein